MKLELKKDLQDKSEFIDLKLKKLINDNLNNREYVETLFSIYDISFDDYSELSKFTGLMLKNLDTNVVANYKKDSQGVISFNSINRISYTVLSNINLNRVISKDELRQLILDKKVILIKRNDVDVLTYEGLDIINDKDFKCLSDYDFNNLNNNSILHNDLIVSFVRSKYDIPVIRNLEKEYMCSFKDMLVKLKENSESLKSTISKKI